MESIDPLDRVGWLSEQPDDFRVWAATAGRWRTYAPGQFIYHAGDLPDGLYGLGAGTIELTFPLVAEEAVTVYRAEVGFWIGDAAELAEVPRSVSVTAATHCKLFHLPSRAIHLFLNDHPQHWRSFYRLSSANSRKAIMLLAEVLALTVRARVCRRLLALTKATQEAELTQEDLAKIVGVTRPTLRRCLNELAALDAIEMQYRKLRVLNPAVLENFKDEQ